ncbi:hypothetical protein SNA_36785 [Streptomyces natalensis ATCC 27448]|uniref:TPM domain-containing protein n=1 Tax=Streptomyces natalensis ATCC 27448 TaxID=1240678 RepID=A0A0D7CC02_9ACTN|nr:hypothetical protein SNA_36785 [Streptomyces natalensis ATCC 27448]
MLVAGWLAVLFTAGVAHAAPAGGDTPTRTAYLAERLRENPVYVTDQLPRAVPRSTAPAFAEEARRLGVPTYVIVLPSEADMGSDALLAGVHDRLGRKGLYVSLDESGLTDVQTYGVSVPGAHDARWTTMYESPYDATAHEEFRYFVDVLTSGHAAQRAKEAEKEYGGAYPAHEPANWHTTRTDREDQSFGTGVVVAGVPLLALLVTVFLRRHRHTRRLTVAAAALALSGVLAFTASQIFDDTSSGDGSYPTAADMRARTDRVAAGLRRDPLYVDPESPPVLDAAARARLRKRLAALHLPVVIAALPTPMDDESGGSADLLAKSLHDKLHRNALIVLADPANDRIDTFNYGARIDSEYLFERPHDLSYAESSAHPATDLGSRLDKLLGYIAKTPPAKPGSEVAPTPAPDPKQEQTLPGLFTGDFEPGLFIGTLLAVLLFGLVAAVAALIRRIRRRGGHQVDAPDLPSRSWLRQTATRELDALGKAVDPAAAPSAKQERRAWECLDAAVMLLDGDSDARIDADASPADLVCAIVLARAGLAAVRDALPTQHVCHRNPLHGPAGKVRPSGRKGRGSPVCEACRAAPGAVLRLRPTASSGSGSAVPYPTLPGPLAALGDGAGIDQLTREIREHYGVH